MIFNVVFLSFCFMIANKCESKEELNKKLEELMAPTPQHAFGTCGLSVMSIPPLWGELRFWKAEVSHLLLNMLVWTRFQSWELTCHLRIVIIGFVAANVIRLFFPSTHYSTTCLMGLLKNKRNWCLWMGFADPNLLINSRCY